MKPPYTFDDLYDQYYEKINGYLSGLVGLQNSEDLSQEVFNKVNNKLSQFKGESSISTWIYRIATNTAKDRFRSASYRQETMEIASIDNDRSMTPSYLQIHIPQAMDKEIIRKEMQACIREFVVQLPQDYRAVILLSEFEEFSNREIAQILGISLNNVKIRLHRARVMLKELFNNGCDFYYTDQNELACDRKQPKKNNC